MKYDPMQPGQSHVLVREFAHPLIEVSQYAWLAAHGGIPTVQKHVSIWNDADSILSALQRKGGMLNVSRPSHHANLDCGQCTHLLCVSETQTILNQVKFSISFSWAIASSPRRTSTPPGTHGLGVVLSAAMGIPQYHTDEAKRVSAYLQMALHGTDDNKTFGYWARMFMVPR